jgi:hypothetical protein
MNANDLFKAVMEVDLTPIKMKLMHVESGEGWSLEKANAVEQEYRRFLCLMKLFPDEDTAPQVDVDTFWHYHILDTMKYAADCEQVFGYFLHHYPYVGMDGSADEEQFRLDSGERMRDLYEATFGDAYPASIDETPSTQASAHIESAYCASPHVAKIAARSRDSATAYCASPHIENVVAPNQVKATAYCASPHVAKIAARSRDSATAYCASPHIARIAARSRDSATAYCASPHTRAQLATPA